MHMAVAQDSDEWLAGNTAYCHRLSASITQSACFHNRYSKGKNVDLRCEGCGGLNNQPDPAARPPFLSIVSSEVQSCPQNEVPQILDNETGLDKEELDPFAVALMSILEKGEDEVEAEPETVDSEPVNLEELDPLTRALLARLWALDDEEAPEPAREMVEFQEPVERIRRVRVYVGRCERCSGYMIRAARECHDGITDDEIYKCCNCGFWVSPASDSNRKHPGGGWR